MLRFCIILGAMKAGTTSLFNYLSQHPEVAPCSNKEPSFFTQQHCSENLSSYLDLWHGQDLTGKVLMEASTNYTKFPCPAFANASKNLLDFSNKHDVQIKFIYIMRHPVDRILSHYKHLHTPNISHSSSNDFSVSKQMIHVSQYALQLDQYYEKFNAENILLLDFDDLKNNPQGLLKKTCCFLNIDTSFEFPLSQKIFNPSEIRLANKKIHRLYERFRFLQKFSNRLPKGLKVSLLKKLAPFIHPKLTLTQQEQQRIHNLLKKDMDRLQEKYGVDVKKWGF